MLVLMDTAGCSGFKLIKGSTPYLVIGLVIFKDFKTAEKVSLAVHKLQQTLNIYPEFNFNKTSLHVQSKFFDKILKYDFDVRVLIADKVGIDVPSFRKNATAFYEYLMKTLLEYNADVLSDVSIKINQHMDRKFKNILTKNLSEQAAQHQIKKFKFSSPQHDALIQLADMITGLVDKTFTDDSLELQMLFNKLVETNKIKSLWKLRESS